MSTGRILLITGWGVGATALIPLQSALQQQGHQVQLFDFFDAEQDIYCAAQTADLIVGWSLGGQLAIRCAARLYQDTQTAPKIMTLASNPCFVAKENWPYAMSVEQFFQFKTQFNDHPAQTLKQFYFNICRGEAQLKAAAFALQSHVTTPPFDALQHGLSLLETINALQALEFPITSHHLFASNDTLVPSQVQHALKQVILSPRLTTATMSNVSHAFPVLHPHATADAIHAFLQQEHQIFD